MIAGAEPRGLQTNPLPSSHPIANGVSIPRCTRARASRAHVTDHAEAHWHELKLLGHIFAKLLQVSEVRAACDADTVDGGRNDHWRCITSRVDGGGRNEAFFAQIGDPGQRSVELPTASVGCGDGLHV
jgi:hypothetical protein